MGDTGVGRAFIGSFTSAGGPGVVAASVDTGTGALTATAATRSVTDPSYLAATDSVLYAVSETADGAVAAFDITGGALRPLGEPVPVDGHSPTHLALAGARLLTAHYGSGSVSVLPLRPDGSPGPVSSVVRYEGRGPDPDRQTRPHAHQALPDPSGRWMLAVDLGADAVRVHALDTVTGTPAAHRTTALPPGTGPRHLAFHPGGRHAYVLGELEPTLTVCRWDDRNGTLEPVAAHRVLPDGAAGPAYPSALVVAPDGRRLWAAIRGHDGIAVLDLDETAEEAQLVATVPCGGHWPRDLALDPSGRRLYAANERSGDVTWFHVDQATGIPQPTGSLPVPAASCVVLT
ncbi:lactonase family protein [Streptomyces sp. NPDC049597]|uniref:lactonase family protein n=1 Tax=Streptomyces sp. NPDC049597 TaxID=3155276 RepID=UPI00343167DA